MRHASVVALVLFVGVGCAANAEYMGRVLKAEDVAYIRRQNPLSTLEVTIRPEGVPQRGHIVEVDGTETIVALPERQVVIANERITEIRARHRVVPALEGMLLGAVGGAASGAVTAVVLCSPRAEGCFELDTGGAAVLIGATFAVIGAVVGLVAGAARGRTTSYWYGSFGP